MAIYADGWEYKLNHISPALTSHSLQSPLACDEEASGRLIESRCIISECGFYLGIIYFCCYILVTFCFWIHFLVFLLKRSSCSHIKAVFFLFCSQLLKLEDNFSATRRGNALLLLSRVTLLISCVLSPPPKVCLLHLSGSVSSIPLCV